MGSEKTLKNAETIFVALLVIGLIGLLFLIVFGNLSGNLGFDATTGLGAKNDTMTVDNITAVQMNSTFGINNPSVSSVVVTLEDTGQVMLSGNYTVTGVTLIATGITSNITSNAVFVTYELSGASAGRDDTDQVIENLTGGAVQFFSFANVWFILTAVTVLIGIVIGVIALVRRTGGTGKGKERNSDMGRFTG